ncbi:MAG: hypothetical protein IH623_30120 [Verrucomicrobia bacterium]|nr:hypothetical protein [Verrucomicrobiota bacterium]
MKTRLHSSFSMLHSSFVMLAALVLVLIALPSRAQDNKVTVSAADFQRMVYSAHLYTQLALKPELGACLQTLLEMQRRNPNADPMALADVSRQALQFYRTNEPVYIRTNGYADEILAAYLDALRHIPAHTNFVPANLTLLNYFMLGPADYDPNVPPATLITSLVNSGNQRLYASENGALKRQKLADDCVARTQGNAAFASAMDSVLYPETGARLGETPAEIIGNTNSPLHDNLTMTNLLALSQASGNGSLTVSSNYLTTLFTSEMQTIQSTINTNLAVLAQINQSQPDYLAYLTNQAAIDANVQLIIAVQKGQPARLASATAAVLFQSRLLPADGESAKKRAQIQSGISAGAQIGLGTAALCAGNPQGIKSVLSGGFDLFNMFSGGQSAEDVMANQLENIQTSINDLSQNVDYRFDRVDRSLTTIYDTLNTEFDKIEISFDNQGRQIANLHGNVDAIRSTLVHVQSSLNRIEQGVFFGFSTSERDEYLLGPANAALFYEVQNPGKTMTWTAYASSPNYENSFYTYAATLAHNDIFSPHTSLNLSYSHLQQQLANLPLGANLNYLAQFLNTTLGVSTVGTATLPNPQEWFMGAYAYMQLATENPMLFREKALRLGAIISQGQNLANFCSSLAFSGTNVNWTLWNALENDYIANLINFNSQVSAIETEYANANNFNVGSWRQWQVAAPRVTATATAVLGPLDDPSSVTQIAAGRGFSLALKANGTVVRWGNNATIPTGLTNVVAIAAGDDYSLALKADGTVVGWGNNSSGQTTIPAGLTNVVAIAAGKDHSLALKTDGTVVGWGVNLFGQTTIPPGLTNVVAIAAGIYHNLALKADGTVVGWGYNDFGQITIPAGLTNVVAIAAGYAHSLALKADGTVVGWGSGLHTIPAGLTNVVAIAAAYEHSLAFKADGTVVGWGINTAGQTTIPAGLTNVVAIAAGRFHSLALEADGTVVGWGNNAPDLNTIPADLTNVMAIAAGSPYSLALKADGTVVGWGLNYYGGITIPVGLTNVVAIAAGVYHSLALKTDGTVVGWGAGLTNNPSDSYDSGQSIIPVGLTNVVAIAAGGNHSLALKADGTVVGWGYNYFGQTTIPAGLTNVVGIAAGGNHSLALKADGTVVGWGRNLYGAITIPAGLTNVVAIAAGDYHSLALKTDGTVVGWGYNSSGQTTIPAGLTNVVAIAAGSARSLALKADGTVVGWGINAAGLTTIPAGLTNVVAIAVGGYQNLFLTATDTGGSTASGSLSFIRAELPDRVGPLIQSCNQNTLVKLAITGSDLENAGRQLSGAKALLSAVLELGMPYTLAHDGVLRGFLYGSEPLVDTGTATTFLQNQNAQLQASPKTAPQPLTVEGALRYVRFQDRLNQCLTNLQTTGQPEIPRLVGHTLRLLDLLSDSWTTPANSPPPVLKLSSQGNTPSLLLYGEPYMNYTLQYQDSLGAPGWTTTTLTNLQDEQTIIPPFSGGPQRFYRLMLPTP